MQPKPLRITLAMIFAWILSNGKVTSFSALPTTSQFRPIRVWAESFHLIAQREYKSTRIRHATTHYSSSLDDSSIQVPSRSKSSEPVEFSSSPSNHGTKHVVVVGAGIGGLAVASRIAAANDDIKVTILEKNSQVGGRCGSFWVDIGNNLRIRHERGPSLLLLPETYRQLFAETTGKSADDYGLKMTTCVPAYQVVFEDGDRLSVGFPATATASDDSIRRMEQVSRAKMNSYEPNGAGKWDEYMDITSAYLDCGLPNFIEERLDLLSFPNFLMKSLKDSAKAWPLKPHSDVLDAIFDSDKLKALASFQDLYVGLEPYKNSDLFAGGVLQSTAPAVFGLLAAIELHPTNNKAGVFAPIGGFQAVTDAMERLANELGIKISCDTTVTAINKDVVHIRDTEGQRFLPADLVIVNADLPYASKSLLKEEQKSTGPPAEQKSETMETYDWDEKFSFSSGVVSFHWSLDKRLEDLITHNVFLMAESRSKAEASWHVLRPPKQQIQTSVDKMSFNFYVHRPTATDPTAAPGGYDSIMVLVPCKTLLREEEFAKLPREKAMGNYKLQFSDSVISEMRAAVLARLGTIETLSELEKHIIDEVVDTPASWANQFNLAAGTPFALSHGFAQLSLTRPGPKSSGLPNVLFCGASSRPGNGVPLVLIGAKQVAEMATKTIKTMKQSSD